MTFCTPISSVRQIGQQRCGGALAISRQAQPRHVATCVHGISIASFAAAMQTQHSRERSGSTAAGGGMGCVGGSGCGGGGGGTTGSRNSDAMLANGSGVDAEGGS